MSLTTTNLGPRVAVSPAHSYAAGPVSLGVLDLTDSRTLLRSTASSASSSVLTDGELVVVNVSATTATLAFRSGNTVYLWPAASAQAI